MRYVLDYGSANTGGSPAFSFFVRLDTLAAVTQPTIHELGSGEYYFDYDWATAPSGVSSIAFKATLAGIELSDVISSTPPPGSTTIGSGGSAAVNYEAAGSIINDALTECGLAPVTDPFSSTDSNFIKARALLKTFGRQLVMDREWSHLQNEAAITTVLGQASYALPDDFQSMIPQTGWNRTTRFPMGGPATPQEWQYLSSRLVGVVFRTIFRKQQNLINIYPPNGSVPAGQDIRFEYQSNWWVAPTGQTSPTTDEATAQTDVVWFDPLLMVRGLKWQFLRNSGLPGATEAGEDYQRTYATVAGGDSRARMLSICNPTDSFPLIGPFSIPVTGLGS